MVSAGPPKLQSMILHCGHRSPTNLSRTHLTHFYPHILSCFVCLAATLMRVTVEATRPTCLTSLWTVCVEKRRYASPNSPLIPTHTSYPHTWEAPGFGQIFGDEPSPIESESVIHRLWECWEMVLMCTRADCRCMPALPTPFLLVFLLICLPLGTPNIWDGIWNSRSYLDDWCLLGAACGC